MFFAFLTHDIADVFVQDTHRIYFLAISITHHQFPNNSLENLHKFNNNGIS